MLYVCLRTVHIHTHRGTYTTLFTVYTSLLCTCIYTQKILIFVPTFIDEMEKLDLREFYMYFTQCTATLLIDHSMITV